MLKPELAAKGIVLSRFPVLQTKFDLKAPVMAGDKIALTLIVEGRDKERKAIEITAVARAINGAPAHKMP